jgi:hypothetical protein
MTYFNPETITVVTYGDVIKDFTVHPEPKFIDIDGNVCGPHTVGRLYRRHILFSGVDAIGKESNKIEEAEKGMFDLDEIRVKVSSSDMHWDQLRKNVFAVLSRYRDVENARLAGLSKAEYKRVKKGEVRPHRKARTALIEMALELACADMGRKRSTIKDARTLLTEWKIR